MVPAIRIGASLPPRIGCDDFASLSSYRLGCAIRARPPVARAGRASLPSRHPFYLSMGSRSQHHNIINTTTPHLDNIERIYYIDNITTCKGGDSVGNPEEEIINAAEFARRLGVDRSAVSRYVRDGKLEPYSN